MKIKFEHDLSANDIEVIVRYPSMNKEVERLESILKIADTRIRCTNDGRETLVSVSDIYYFESVDKMTFVYCEKDVYRTDLRLYQVVEDFAYMGFVQINKACVLNINKLEAITPLYNSRMEASLINSEKLYVTRKYLENIKQAFLEVV